MMTNKAIGEGRKAPIRCEWADGVNERYLEYHDVEWGVPVHEDLRQFEFLILEGAQAGLSWATILNKRDGYRKAFAGFDLRAVARFGQAKIDRLLVNPDIVRNRLKIHAAVSNAERFLQIQREYGSFDDYVWQFVSGRPIINHWSCMEEIPSRSKESDALSRDLKQRGFKFVGTTIVYAHMQAVGMVNDHVVSCFRHRYCARLK